MEQNDFLASIRTALGYASSRTASDVPGLFDSRFGAFADEQDTLLAAAERTPEEQAALIDTLCAAATPINLAVHVAATTAEASAIIANLAAGIDTEWGGDKQIVMHDHPLLHDLQLGEAMQARNITLHCAGETDEQNTRTTTIASYIGITSAQWCVADSATIVLETSPQQPRATSLVPSVHIAVIRQNQILSSLPELYAQLALRASEGEELPSSITYISGPSKTADIEACMVHGAHGPREMHLVVIQD